MRGMPLDLSSSRRANFSPTDAPEYRLFELPGTVPAKPGLLRVGAGGTGIDLEGDGRLEPAAFGRLVAGVRGPLTIGDVRLADGTSAKGYLAEAQGVDGAADISDYGGWRA